MYFEHDVVPIQKDFWDKVDEARESIDGIDDKVGMVGENSVLYVSPDGRTSGGGSYDYGLERLDESDLIDEKTYESMKDEAIRKLADDENLKSKLNLFNIKLKYRI